jgi:hypothetical protein
MDVQIPPKAKEVEIQAWLWYRLCELGFHARMEYAAGDGFVDLVIADKADKIFMAAELKRHGILDRHREQVMRYVNELKVPVAFIASERQARSLLRVVRHVDPYHVNKREGNRVIAQGGFEGVFVKRGVSEEKGQREKILAREWLKQKIRSNPRYG